MSQKLIIGVMAAVILVGGGAWYYQTNISGSQSALNGGREAREGSDENNESILDTLKSGAGSFADILSSGDSLKCDFEGVDPDTKESMEGTIYVDGQSFKMNARTTIDGKETTINMIQHEMVVYMWSEDEEAVPGVKIDMRAFENMEGYEQPESPIDILKNPESGIKHDCDRWSSRGDSFEPPADVEFMDMFGEMGKMFGGMTQEGMMGIEAEGEAEAGWDY